MGTWGLAETPKTWRQGFVAWPLSFKISMWKQIVLAGGHNTASYNAFSAGDVIWDGIRMQGINVWCLLIPKMYFSFDLIDVQLYTVKIWHPCIFSTKIWTSIKSSKKYIFGILKCHISTPCTQIPSQNPSPTYKPFKDTVLLLPSNGHGRPP